MDSSESADELHETQGKTSLRPAGGASRRKFIALASVAIATVMVVSWFISHRNQALQRLYATAAGDPDYSRGPQDSAPAVRALAAYRGQQSTSLLLDLALGKENEHSVFGGGQLEAIRMLRDRKEPMVAEQLSALLQPDVGLDEREAVAESLQSLPCEDACIRFILHYLERIWRGEENAEDLLITPKELSGTRQYVQDKQKRLYANLDSILAQQSAVTMRNLKNIYGIGGPLPSPFALDLLSRLRLKDSCPLLLRSDRELREVYPEQVFRAPRKELETTIASVNCRSK